MSRKREKPEINHDRFEVATTPSKETGITMHSITDLGSPERTAITIAELNPDLDPDSTLAWAMARTSRSDAPYAEIFAEIHQAYVEGGRAPIDALSKVFLGYGHASVGDMADAALLINNIPIIEAFRLFNLVNTGAGQELSTRYVELENLGIPSITTFLKDIDTISESDTAELEAQWEEIRENSVRLYHEWYKKLHKLFKENHKESQKSTLKARTLDIARLWIPAGAITSMSLRDSVRNWADHIKALREVGDPGSSRLADHILYTIQLNQRPGFEDIPLNAGKLAKYTESDNTISNNLKTLKEYLEADPAFADHADSNNETTLEASQVSMIASLALEEGGRTLLQYIHTVYPEVTEERILSYLESLSAAKQKELGEIVLNGHNNHKMMRRMGDVRGTLYSIDTSLAYLRDFNRHRAMGRFVPILEAPDLSTFIDDGFHMNHQIANTSFLSHLKNEWEEDARCHYEMIYKLVDTVRDLIPEESSHRYLLRILPLGHQTKMHMSGPLTQWSYMLNLRSKPGGDQGYIHVANLVLEDLRKSPFLSTLGEQVEILDLESTVQFQDRS